MRQGNVAYASIEKSQIKNDKKKKRKNVTKTTK